MPKPSRADVYLYPAGASRVAARKCNVAGVHTNSRRVEALRHLLEADVKIRGWTVTSNGWLFWSVVGRTFVSGSSPASRRRNVSGLIKQSFEPRRHYWRCSRSPISGPTNCSSGEIQLKSAAWYTKTVTPVPLEFVGLIFATIRLY